MVDRDKEQVWIFTFGYQDERKTPSFSYGDISDKSQ